MTKDEDDWLSDFLELAQASARQSQMASEKEYSIRLKLLSPRIERARVCDTDEALAKKVAASEALAGQNQFDAAADQLDAAFALAGRLLETAAAGAASDAECAEPADVIDEPPAEKAPESREASSDAIAQELPSEETPVVETPVSDLDAMLEEVPSGEAAAAEKPVEENPLGDLDTMLEEAPSGEAAAAEKPVEENPLGDLDAMLEELPAGESAVSEASTEVPAPDSDTDHSEKKEQS